MMGMTTTAVATEWWICTDWLARGGRKVLGPFVSRDLALDVRGYYEKARHEDGRYFVDEERERS